MEFNMLFIVQSIYFHEYCKQKFLQKIVMHLDSNYSNIPFWHILFCWWDRSTTSGNTFSRRGCYR